MEIAFNTIQFVLPTLYTLLLIAYGRLFTQGPGGLALFVRPILIGTLAIHFVSIGLQSAIAASCPLGTGAGFLSLTALSIALLYVILEMRTGVRSVGIFAMAMAFVFQFLAAVSVLGTDGPHQAKMGFLGSLHMFGAIVGFSAVVISDVFGFLYLLLYAAIKRGKFGLYYRKMPPLETLSELNLAAAWLAFLSLTLTVGLGFWDYFATTKAPFSVSDPAVILAVLLWFLFGVAVFSQRFLRLGGKRLAYTTLLGFVILVGILVTETLKRGFPV
jgi:ABC-type uncharacterized transport system permease subunit